jgi:hypothetical protein
MTVDRLLFLIREYCIATGIAETTFGRIAVNDGKLVGRLQHGGSITLKTLIRVEAELARRPADTGTTTLRGKRAA